MMSASSMSAMIRAKKKKMMETESGTVKLSGIPEDATDIMTIKNHEAGEMLSENTPKESDEEPTLETQMAATKAPQPHESESPDPELDVLKKRKDRIRSMMAGMSK